MNFVRAARVATAAQIREVDSLAVTEYELSIRSLMEEAGRSIAAEIMVLEDASFVVVACGPGNNGGDGMVAARHLSEAGKHVCVLMANDPSELKGEALAQFRRVSEGSATVVVPNTKQFDDTLEDLGECDVVVDALLGTGARLPVTGNMRKIVQAINGSSSLVISADIPTGIDCDTGIGIGDYVIADKTITFGLAKRFLFANDGLTASGTWEVADIGLPIELVSITGDAFVVDDLSGLHRLPRRPITAHKRTSGVILVVAGSKQFPGAATLTALGAYRAGAGMVSVATVPQSATSVICHLPECPVEGLPDEDGFLAPASADRVIEMASRCDAVVIGPGLGRAPSVGAFLDRLFSSLEAQWVIDADALWWLPALAHQPTSPALLTPHEGEAARLAGCSAEEVSRDRFTAIRKIAEMYSHQVLLKGPCTLICDPRGEIAVNQTGSPVLATAGTGDVLAGVAGAYLGILGEPFAAGIAAAYIHGAAGEHVAGQFDGAMGAIAREIAEAIPTARKERLENLVSSLDESDEPDDWDEEWERELDEQFDEEDFDEEPH